MYDNSTVGQQQLHQEHWPRIWQRKPAGYVQPAAAGAPAACVAYGASGPCHGTPSPDLLSNRSSTAGWASITIITVQLLTDAGLLQVHVFTVNVVAHIPTYTRRNGTRFLPQVYRKDTSVCPNNLISILVTISISATWFVGAFDCRRIGLSASWLSANWIVGDLVCRQVGLSASWSVGELVVGELDCRRLGLLASWIVGELVCWRVGCWQVGLSASCP